MVRHVVFVQFRKDVAPQEIEAIFRQLQDLCTLVPGMTNFAGGANISPEGLDRGFTHAFSCDFADVAARDAYLVHPAHRAAAARLVAATNGGQEGLAVIDYDGQ